MQAGPEDTRHSIARLLRHGWSRLAPELLFTHPGEPSLRAWAYAGTLRGGDRSAVGFEGAAYLLGWVTQPPRMVEVWVPRGAQPRPFGRVRYLSDTLGRRPTQRPGCTDPVTTALDLCAGSDVDGMVGWLAKASRGGARSAALRRALERRARQPRRGLLAEMLAEVEAGTESPLERRFLRDVLRAHGLPATLRQVPLAGGRADLVDDAHAVVYELDGRLGHAGEGAFRDARRDNRNAEDGKLTLRYGWRDTAGHACDTAAQAARVLRARGWTGQPRACSGRRYVCTVP
ncbi:type IV toxin-antitoxin system AbiEi family antitoxin domain-containing protein [Mariniluteicoccus flavus]